MKKQEAIDILDKMINNIPEQYVKYVKHFKFTSNKKGKRLLS